MQPTKKEWDKFAEETLPKLKELGYIKEKSNLMILLTTFIIGFTISGILFYGIYNDKFKSISNQEVNVEPNINITSQTSNSYDFDPQINNDYQIKNNYTIYVNNFVTCP